MKFSNIVKDKDNLKPDLYKSSITSDNDDSKEFEIDVRVESIAHELCRRFKSDTSYEFYCLIAYRLPESKIWLNYEKCQRGKNPGGLFNYLCRRDMK